MKNSTNRWRLGLLIADARDRRRTVAVPDRTVVRSTKMRSHARSRNAIVAAAVLAVVASVSCEIDNTVTYPSPPDPPRQYVEVRVAGGAFAHIEAGGTAAAYADSSGYALLALPFGTFPITATMFPSPDAGRTDLVVPPGSGTLPDTAQVAITLGPRGVIRGRAVHSNPSLGHTIGIETAEAHYQIGAMADALGRYALTVPPGHWTVIFRTTGAPPETLTATVADFGDTISLPDVTLGN